LDTGPLSVLAGKAGVREKSSSHSKPPPAGVSGTSQGAECKDSWQTLLLYLVFVCLFVITLFISGAFRVEPVQVAGTGHWAAELWSPIV